MTSQRARPREHSYPTHCNDVQQVHNEEGMLYALLYALAKTAMLHHACMKATRVCQR